MCDKLLKFRSQFDRAQLRSYISIFFVLVC